MLIEYFLTKFFFFVFVVAEFLMNGFELFAKVILFLPFFYAFAHAVADPAFGFFDLFARNQYADKQFRTLNNRRCLQNLLFFFLFGVKTKHRYIYIFIDIFNLRKFFFFNRIGLARIDRGTQFGFYKVESSLNILFVVVFSRQFAHFNRKTVVSIQIFCNFRTIKPFNVYTDSIFKVKTAFYAANHTYVINLFGRWLVHILIYLRRNKHKIIRIGCIAER